MYGKVLKSQAPFICENLEFGNRQEMSYNLLSNSNFTLACKVWIHVIKQK